MPARLPVVVLNDTRVDHHHGCEVVMHALLRGLADAGAEVLATFPAHADWRTDPRAEAAFGRARLVVVNGEGTIHHDRPAGLALLAAADRARARGIPAALVNAGWEANGEAAVAQARGFNLVAVRDEASAAALRAGAVACRVVPDLSLAGAAIDAAGPRSGIGVTDSVDREVTLQLDALRRRLDARAVSVVFPPPGAQGRLRFLREAIARVDLRTPGVLRRRLAARSALLAQATSDGEAFLAQLASLSLLVSGRFHACTLALRAGTPFVAAGTNTRKIQSLIADAGLAPWRASLPTDAAALPGLASRGWSAEEAHAREDYLARARRDATALFADLVALA